MGPAGTLRADLLAWPVHARFCRFETLSPVFWHRAMLKRPDRQDGNRSGRFFEYAYKLTMRLTNVSFAFRVVAAFSYSV
jgi:hypothetical protein